jgi:hypothetical protein
MKLDREPAIARIAHELKVDLSGGPVEGVVRYCNRKVQRWIDEAGVTLTSVRQLEELLCRKLRVVFEEVWSDADLTAMVRRYVGLGEYVFASIPADLDDGTFAALVERHHVDAAAPYRYVAVIDCRGKKGFRRFFTKWHELAHLMTLTRQLELPFHRSSERSPEERLMDVVGGEIGFFPPILATALAKEATGSRLLTFAGSERVRSEAFPDASGAATLNACVNRWPRAVLLIEAGMGLKNAERERLESSQLALIAVEPPRPELRVLSVKSSGRARTSRFRVDPHMAVPPDSGLYGRYFDTIGEDSPQAWTEDLSLWRHSDGTAVGNGLVHLELGPRHGNSLYALVQRG